MSDVLEFPDNYKVVAVPGTTEIRLVTHFGEILFSSLDCDPAVSLATLIEVAEVHEAAGQ